MGFRIEQDRLLELRILGVMNGRPAINILHYGTYNFVGVGGDSADFLDQFRVAYRANILALLCTEYSVGAYQVLQVDAALPIGPAPERKFKNVYNAQDILFGTVDDAGDVDTECLPNYAAVSVRKFSLDVAKYWRGGLRIPGVPEEDTEQQGNVLKEISHAAFQAAVVATYQPTLTVAGGVGNTTDVTPSIYSGTLLAYDAPPGSSPFDCSRVVTSWQARYLLGSQVSRKLPIVF